MPAQLKNKKMEGDKMEQRSLRVVETNKTFFNKITNTLSKLLVPTRLGLNSMMISIKRNSLLKAYVSYMGAQDEAKKELAAKKYEDAYSLYLEVIDKNIMDSVYKKVKNDIAIGLALGATSHVIATAKCVETGRAKQVTMSSLALVVVGILTAIIIPIFLKLF